MDRQRQSDSETHEYLERVIVPTLPPDPRSEEQAALIGRHVSVIRDHLCSLDKRFARLSDEEQLKKAARLYRIRWTIREITGDYEREPDRKEVQELTQLDKHNPLLGADPGDLSRNQDRRPPSVLLLEATRQLEDDGHRRSARRFYELIAREFRGTAVGDVAREAARTAMTGAEVSGRRR